MHFNVSKSFNGEKITVKEKNSGEEVAVNEVKIPINFWLICISFSPGPGLNTCACIKHGIQKASCLKLLGQTKFHG